MTTPAINFNREGLGRRFLSLCSGIEAASVAWTPLGWQCAAVAEIEKFPCAVLKHHFPEVPNLGDVNLITREQVESLGSVDVVIFGFPCQDLSVAGKRKGLKNADGTNTRSGLFFKCFEVSRWTKARWIVVENVPGLFSGHEGRDFAAVVGELAGCAFDVPRDGWCNAGVALGPNGLVEWAVLDAQYMHLAQRRERVFLVLDTGNWRDRPPLLSDATSLRGYSAPCRKAGKGITHDLAPCLGASGRGFDRCGDTRGQDAVIPTMRVDGDAHSGYRDADGLVDHTLRGEGFDASEDGTGRGTPIVPEIAFALTTRNERNEPTTETFLPVAFPANLSSTQHANAEDLSPAIGAEHPTAVAFERRMVRTTGGQPQTELQHALRADSGSGDGAPCVQWGMAVRRLTPTECERLQGFPDGWTAIPWRGKTADKCPDGNRYKALGNSMAVPVINFIGRQIERVESYEKPLINFRVRDGRG
jgi:DNA (cytosine-5)-methyltransferase 1